jgi:hypothetical protein
MPPTATLEVSRPSMHSSDSSAADRRHCPRRSYRTRRPSAPAVLTRLRSPDSTDISCARALGSYGDSGTRTRISACSRPSRARTRVTTPPPKPWTATVIGSERCSPRLHRWPRAHHSVWAFCRSINCTPLAGRSGESPGQLQHCGPRYGRGALPTACQRSATVIGGESSVVQLGSLSARQQAAAGMSPGVAELACSRTPSTVDISNVPHRREWTVGSMRTCRGRCPTRE